LQQQDCVAVGEIGLDTFLNSINSLHFSPSSNLIFLNNWNLLSNIKSQCYCIFAKHMQKALPFKSPKIKFGGIAHAFSGGVEEAKALVKLGFKIGVTGQITNPNAKKLHQVVQALGSEHLVIETDCPDMTPLCCQTSTEHRTRNTPVNLPYVLESLAQTLDQSERSLATQLWQNSLLH
jgi:TatD DNase family protein